VGRDRSRFVAIVALVEQRYPDADAHEAIAAHRVEINGAIVSNPKAQVRDDAAVKLRREAQLQGELKLAGALSSFDVTVRDKVSLDVGAAAGGFTSALLLAGASRVYAVDTGHGQLMGRLRQDSRVVNLERTNLGDLNQSLIDVAIEIITMDLSYLTIADALPQLERVPMAGRVDLLALVKPTFELRHGTLASDDESVKAAIAIATEAATNNGWVVQASAPSAVTGHHGAREAFIHGLRQSATTSSVTRPSRDIKARPT
jgi:23S rRNA (cytidine1920-2'-O)/16S rRNA (cytidine1409-2'-O)-methyltransferase